MAGLAAVRRAFYRGDIAHRILAHQREHDGLLAAADLETFRCQIVPSISRRFRFNGEAVEVHTCGAWCQGPFLLEALAIAEAAGVETLEQGSDAHLHAVAETLKLTFADREAYLGDPDFVDVPLDTLTGSAYAAERSKAIDPRKASPGMPRPGRIPGHEAYVVAGRRVRRGARAAARYLDRLRDRRRGKRALLDAFGHELGHAGGAGHRARGLLAGGAVTGGAGPSLLYRAGQAARASRPTPASCCRRIAGSCRSGRRAATRRFRRTCRRCWGTSPSA